MLVEITASQINMHQIEVYFSKLSREFLADLKSQIELEKYLIKIEKLSNHIVAFEEIEIVGTLFYYSKDNTCFITHISVLPEYERLGIGCRLFNKLLETKNNENIELEVHPNNQKAIKFYQKLGFLFISSENSNLRMRKHA
jgi:ribosomal protein S18 acetylase RimI-like enzyme